MLNRLLDAIGITPQAPEVWGSNGWALGSEGDAYFPNGMVATGGASWSPVTAPGHPADPMHGPENAQDFQTGAYPDRDDGPQWSMEQGIGRSPGQRWPHMPHVEQYNFEASTGIGWHEAELDIPADSAGHPVVNRRERAGWALVGPEGATIDASYYYGQGPAQHFWKSEPINIETPHSQPYMSQGWVPAE